MEMKAINSKALITLKGYRGKLTPQQYRTIRGQILSGDDAGAMKGLRKLISH